MCSTIQVEWQEGSLAPTNPFCSKNQTPFFALHITEADLELKELISRFLSTAPSLVLKFQHGQGNPSAVLG